MRPLLSSSGRKPQPQDGVEQRRDPSGAARVARSPNRGRRVAYGSQEKQPPGGALTVIMNVIWILLPGLELAIAHLVLAALLAITIVGLPFAAQHLKLVRMALLPFGFQSANR